MEPGQVAGVAGMTEPERPRPHLPHGYSSSFSGAEVSGAGAPGIA